jgi:hypothetical protein
MTMSSKTLLEMPNPMGNGRKQLGGLENQHRRNGLSTKVGGLNLVFSDITCCSVANVD